MDRGAWQATVHGVARVGHNLGTKPPTSENLQYSTGNYSVPFGDLNGKGNTEKMGYVADSLYCTAETDTL